MNQEGGYELQIHSNTNTFDVFISYICKAFTAIESRL